MNHQREVSNKPHAPHDVEQSNEITKSQLLRACVGSPKSWLDRLCSFVDTHIDLDLAVIQGASRMLFMYITNSREGVSNNSGNA